MEESAQKQEIQNKKVERKLLGKNFLFVWRIQPAASAKQAGGVDGSRGDEAAAKNGDYERSDEEIRSKGRMEAENRWWVSELLGTDCEKAWTHTGWEDTLQKWFYWLEEMKKKDDKAKMGEMHQHKVARMIKSAEGSAGLLHKITKPTPWRREAQILEKEEEDAGLLGRCEAKIEEWAKTLAV